MYRINNLTKKYENGNVAINDISLDIADKGLVAIVGASGSGKTTLLNLLALNDSITSGTIIYDNLIYNKQNKSILNEQFAYIYQDFKLIENISCYENLSIAMQLSGKTENETEILEILAKVGIESFAKEKVLNLSSGQKQRVAIARALIRNPKVLFADEPTGNLDSENTENIFAFLKDLSKEILVILVTHDTETIENYADRLIKLKDGKIQYDKPCVSTIDSEIKGTIKEPVQFNNYSQAKSKLSLASIWTLSKSLNTAKIARKITFSVIIVLLISIMSVLLATNIITYEKAVIGSFNRYSNTKSMIINHQIKDYAYEDMGVNFTTYIKNTDLNPLKDYLNNNLKANTAKVLDCNDLQLRGGTQFAPSYDINQNPISLADSMSGAAIRRIILTDTPEKLDIKIIKGVAPKNKNEIAIPKGLYNHIHAVGGIMNSDKNGYIAFPAESLIGYEVNGVTITGIFDDNLVIPSKYYKYSANNNEYNDLISAGEDKFDDIKRELRNIINGNMLSEVIIASNATEEYYRDTYFLDQKNEGDFIETKIIFNDFNRRVGIAPININTETFTKISSLKKDNILISKYLADEMGIRENDTIQINSDWCVNSPKYQSEYYTGIMPTKKIATRTLMVKISDEIKTRDKIFVNEEDFNTLIDNSEIPYYSMYFNKANITLGDLNQISKFLDKQYPNTIVRDIQTVNYSFDYSNEVYGNFELIKSLNIIILVVLLIIFIIYLLLSYNISSVNISSKANELLILKALGAKNKEFIGIYGIVTSIQSLLEIVMGTLIGAVLLESLNGVLRLLNGANSIVFIPFDYIALGILVGIVVVVNTATLLVNIAKINNKNLRKSFQKTKE